MKNIVVFCLLACHTVAGQIAVDGIFDDWKEGDLKVEEAGDAFNLDLTKLWVSNDDQYLYLRIDSNREFDIQDSENISIYIDVDNDPNTGFKVNGLGAEISYYFGNQQGFINNESSFISTNHAGIGMIALPTITSRTFEFIFKRSISSVLGETKMGEVISISIENGGSGDKLPNGLGGIQYAMGENEQFKADFSFVKADSSLTRVMTYNVLRDGFEEQDQKEHLEAVIKAINPDVIAFQEIYNTSLSKIRNFLNSELPNADGSSWEFAKEGPDVVVFTRGLIEAHNSIDGNGVFLVTSKEGTNPIVLYNVHLPCCDNDFDRQREIDRIMSVVRDKEDALLVNFDYNFNVPVIITGDFNMVGESQNYRSFLQGDIVNEIAFGQDFNPDWDGSDFEDANPYVTGFPSNYTWRNNNSGYNPGKLDFVFYAGSVMTNENSFVLATEFLSPSELNALNLNSNSTALASDHLPVVVDFSMGINDADMDGFTSDVDCDDFNPNVNPEATEIANNDIDENCDGIVLVIDVDMDGFNSDVDCDDNNSGINPAAIEIVNNDIDENCDGEAVIVDEDRDGFNSDEDCDDFNPDVNPGEQEIANNDIDEDCDGIAQVIDLDMDGFNSDVDCDDSNAAINPGAEEIPNNDIDEDCDGADLTSSIEETKISSLEIYPNPSENVLFVKLQGGTSYDLEIYQANGTRLMVKSNCSKETGLDISNLASGLYFVRLIDQNEKSILGSFIKL